MSDPNRRHQSGSSHDYGQANPPQYDNQVGQYGSSASQSNWSTRSVHSVHTHAPSGSSGGRRSHSRRGQPGASHSSQQQYGGGGGQGLGGLTEDALATTADQRDLLAPGALRVWEEQTEKLRSGLNETHKEIYEKKAEIQRLQLDIARLDEELRMLHPRERREARSLEAQKQNNSERIEQDERKVQELEASLEEGWKSVNRVFRSLGFKLSAGNTPGTNYPYPPEILDSDTYEPSVTNDNR